MADLKTIEARMSQALRLAERARGKTSPNPLVGAVIYKDDKLVGKGYHKGAGLPHAEVEALAGRGRKSRGADAVRHPGAVQSLRAHASLLRGRHRSGHKARV